MDAPLKQEWTLEIGPKKNIFDINFRELWHYRDLLLLMVRRDFIAFYKQTILGPVWFFVQPMLTTLTYLIIFGKVADLPTDETPKLIFYLAGVTCWTYINESLTKTSDTFITNANIFGKVYFPRLIIPLSIILSNLIRLGIQMILFLLIWGYYLVFDSARVHPNGALFILPLLVLLMALLSLALGIIFSSLTTKYRDLRFLLTFGVQLLMFATPVVYPLSLAEHKSPFFKWLIIANPYTAIVETFRYAFLGSGTFSWGMIGYSTASTLIILAIGVIIFNRIERSFMDVV